MEEQIARLASILELHIRAEKAIRAADATLGATHPHLSYTDFRTLGCIVSSGPLSLHQLATALELPKTTLHYVVRKLEAAAYVGRSAVPPRGLPVLQATDAGRAAWAAAVAALLAGPVGWALQQLSAEALAEVAGAMRRLWAATGAEAHSRELTLEARALAVAAAAALRARGPQPGP